MLFKAGYSKNHNLGSNDVPENLLMYSETLFRPVLLEVCTMSNAIK